MEKIHTNIKKFFESKVYFNILVTIGILITLGLVFGAGISVGVHKSSFGRAWGEHYNENFGMGRKNTRPVFNMMRNGNNMMNYFPNAHGATGKIIKLELPNIIIQDKDNIEKIISLNNDTQIQKARENIKVSDLKIDDFIVVIGTPNEKGVIEAKFIRELPSPEFLTQ